MKDRIDYQFKIMKESNKNYVLTILGIEAAIFIITMSSMNYYFYTVSMRWARLKDGVAELASEESEHLLSGSAHSSSDN